MRISPLEKFSSEGEACTAIISPYTSTHNFLFMLTIEKKRTDKVDWVKPLQKYISTQYTEESAKEHTEALNALQQMREDCRNSVDKSDAVKDMWYKYVV